MIFKFEGDGARRLGQWLSEDDNLTRATISVSGPPTPAGDQGVIVDVVRVLVDSTPLITAVLAAARTWLDRGQGNCAFTVHVPCANGSTFSATVRTAAEASEVEARFRRDCAT
ncbi:hypothetical protein EDD90_1631 [Streptomyces sp. Ag109_O5-1]|uniref:effector-associated constant component EACC1 n=1 Tax=Streptomyces TaxID=1883 RepID=UPI000FBEEF1D|nr:MULTISPECIES: hypothetical protein [Streptomyces]RPE38706.1 hypothetical protein EDD90_1631 [Streptomyces sp. Ag109_O5-1]